MTNKDSFEILVLKNKLKYLENNPPKFNFINWLIRKITIFRNKDIIDDFNNKMDESYNRLEKLKQGE